MVGAAKNFLSRDRDREQNLTAQSRDNESSRESLKEEAR